MIYFVDTARKYVGPLLKQLTAAALLLPSGTEFQVLFIDPNVGWLRERFGMICVTMGFFLPLLFLKGRFATDFGLENKFSLDATI